MQNKYQPAEFEKKWIEKWEKDGVYKVDNQVKGKKKQYVLAMFPYPSGAGLHVGHVRNYTGTDVMARFFRMNNYSVLHPMGWDAFGLPAENAAVKAKKNPMDMVPDHIANFRRQMKMLGFSYDWDREFSTTDPNYYKWTQWLFIQFFKMGLLYKKNTPINFCPVCKTGLAEEEVLANGTHERCGNKIEKKDLPQWVFAITKYADRLLEDLKYLDWPVGILEMQKNWIGRKEGINITYKVVDSAVQFSSHENLPLKETGLSKVNKISPASSKNKSIDEITCFTTRPDTNFGATFIVLAPEHPFVKKIINKEIKTDEINRLKIAQYVEKSVSKSEIEREAEGRKKTGVFTGFSAVNNLNGRLMPIYISDFVLMGFGTGAVVGVPGHDMRDFEFASEFGIEIIRVVVGPDGDKTPITKREQVNEKEGRMINSEFLNGMDIHEAIKKMIDYLEEKGWGKRVVTYHLRDWIFSRQRYWGEPIPMVFCEKCAKNQSQKSNVKSQIHNSNLKSNNGTTEQFNNEMIGWFPIPEDQLPLKLPYVKSYEPTDTGESPLSKMKDWINTKCPQCHGQAQRETDTMPNWAGSCWYFLRFTDPKNDKNAWSDQALKTWAPVDWYLGGAEHAVLHLLYSRFWVKALYDLKLLDFKEPFIRLRNQGMIIAEDKRKMSKSFGNVINPDDVVAEYGADALRIYEMFMAPFNQEIAWSTSSLQGSYRFISRIWNIFHKKGAIGDKSNSQLSAKLQKTIAKVSEDIPNVKFNTAIAAMMEFINEWENNTLSRSDVKKFLQILAPFAPFTTEELWSKLGETTSIHLSAWPKVDRSAIIEEKLQIPVQVNGKVRSILEVESTIVDDQEKLEESALCDKKIKQYVQGKKYKVIYVQGKIINFILLN